MKSAPIHFGLSNRAGDHRRRSKRLEGIGNRKFVYWIGMAVIMFAATSSTGCRLIKPPVDQDVAQARWLTSLGFDALQKNQVEQARGCFSKACDVCPDDERLRINLAQAHQQSGHYNQAITELNKVLPTANNRADIHKQLGELYLLQSQLQPAMKHAHQAIDANRNMPAGWALKGRVLAAMNEHEKAVACFNRSLTIANDNEYASYQVDQDQIRYDLAESLIKTDRHQKALSVLETIALRYPQNRQPETLALLQSQLFVNMRLLDRAEQTLILAQQNPEASSATFVQLSQVQQMQGKLSAARITMSKAQQRFPRDTSVAARVAEFNDENRDVVIR